MSSVVGYINNASTEHSNLHFNLVIMLPSWTFLSLINVPTCSVSATSLQLGSSQTATFMTRPHRHFGGSRDDASSPPVSSAADLMHFTALAIASSASDGGSPFFTASAAPADAIGNLKEPNSESYRVPMTTNGQDLAEYLRIRDGRSSAIPDT